MQLAKCDIMVGFPISSHISHITLPTSLRNLVIGNGGSIFLCIQSPFLIITCLIHLQALMFKLDIFLDCWEVWYLRYANHPFYVSVIHILKFHCLQNSTSFLVNALVGSFTLLYIISKLYLYPNEYGIVVLVSLMFC